MLPRTVAVPYDVIATGAGVPCLHVSFTGSFETCSVNCIGITWKLDNRYVVDYRTPELSNCPHCKTMQAILECYKNLHESHNESACITTVINYLYNIMLAHSTVTNNICNAHNQELRQLTPIPRALQHKLTPRGTC